MSACTHTGKHLLLWQNVVALDSPAETWPAVWTLVETALNHAFEDEVGDQIPTVRELLERARRGEQIEVDDEEWAACIDVIENACEYMDDNDYANCRDYEAGDLPEDALAADCLGRSGGMALICWANHMTADNAADEVAKFDKAVHR